MNFPKILQQHLQHIPVTPCFSLTAIAPYTTAEAQRGTRGSSSLQNQCKMRLVNTKETKAFIHKGTSAQDPALQKC